MPLNKSGSDDARSRNIREMIVAGRKPSQAKAAAYRNQRKAKRSKRRSSR